MRGVKINSHPNFALIGKSGAGKSEVAKILSADYGCEIVKTGVICRRISQILFGNEDKASTQLLDDALTSIDGSIFLKAALRDIKSDMPIVIDALRFSSDLELALSAGCITVRVSAGDDQRLHRLAKRGQQFNLHENGTHRSETELEDYACDLSVVNDCSLEALRERVVEAVESLCS